MNEECQLCERKFKTKKGLNQHVRFHDPEFRKKHSSNTSKGTILAQDEDYKKRLSESIKLTWQDEDTRKRRSEGIRRVRGAAESRELSSKITKENWEKQGYRERYSETMARKRESGELHELFSNLSKKRWDNERSAMLKYMRKDYSEIATSFADDKEFCKEYIESFDKKPNFSELAASLLIPYSSVVRIVNAHGLRDIVEKSSNTSELEKQLFSFVSKHADAKNNYRGLIHPYELDVYIPEHNVAIEFNGIYWHSGIDKDYHLMKTKLCKDKGVRLIHVFENEWLQNRDVIESIILNSIGGSKKIYARKCEIVEVSSADAKQFFENNHNKGYVSSSVRYGLKFNDELVSVMTFAKPRFDKTSDYELTRFASKLNTSVVGGGSRLMKHFDKNNQYKKLISYCDMSKFTGSGYEKMGFTYVKETVPGYVWVNPQTGEIKSRYQTQMKSEVEVMELAGYAKLYDCGNILYEKVLND